MQYLYQLQATRPEMLAEGPSDKEQAVIAEHLAYLTDLTKRGIVLLAGRTLNTDTSAFGLVIFQADSEPEAQTVMQQDPAVAHGVMQAALYPYRIALRAENLPFH